MHFCFLLTLFFKAWFKFLLEKLKLHNMTHKWRHKDKSLMSKSASKLDVHVGRLPFTLDKELLASQSAKVAAVLKENPHADLSYLLRNFPSDPEALELIARFCHGYEVQISIKNIVPLICMAFYLGMDENHSNNSLLTKAITFFEQRVLHSWTEVVKALRESEKFLEYTMQLGLFDACIQALVEKASDNPRLLGEPLEVSTNNGDTEDVNDNHKPIVRRLFALDSQEDLTTLPFQLYEPIICTMNQHEIPAEYISASIYRYAKHWVFSCNSQGENMSIYERQPQRNIIETLERLLPHGRDLLPCTLLFEMLRCAIDLEASSTCRNGFEDRIGKQLEQAKVEDLLIPSQGYAKEVQYDIECIKRILKAFYRNFSSSDVSGLITVAELIEEFLAEIAGDIDLMMDTFISLADMSIAASAAFGTQRSSDGIYRAIDIYLDKHSYLTEKEKEQVCRVLDFWKLSPEAIEHASRNERLPMRVVVQILFMSQLELRNAVTKEMQCYNERLGKEEEEEEEASMMSSKEDEVRMELEKMSIKVKELENECYLMKKEITRSSSSSRQNMKRGKASVWTEMKRKFGCMTSVSDLHCQVKKKKVHPKLGL